jgi:hypothetical protein
MMAGQAQQTEIPRRLAAWAAILAVPTAVADLRHELRAHAATEVGVRLLDRARQYPRHLWGALPALQTERLAVSRKELRNFAVGSQVRGLPRRNSHLCEF